MAEIRKHKPKITGDIDRALYAALGEDIRPVTPGANRVSGGQPPASQVTAAAVPSFGQIGVNGLSGAGWLSVPPTAAKPVGRIPGEEIDEEDSQLPDEDEIDFDDDYRSH